MRSVLLTNATLTVLLGLLLCAGTTAAQDAAVTKIPMPADWDAIKANPEALAKYRCPKPTEFALVFSFGYGGGDMPADDGRFEQILKGCNETGFNVIYCEYTEKRLELCKKYNVKMMVDFLSRHHVYRTLSACEAVCKKLQGDPAVWGYNIWNDHSRGLGAGRRRDILNVRRWDPTHPAYCGSCQDEVVADLTNADIMGYYTYSWNLGIEGDRGGYPMLHLHYARKYNASYMSWLSTRTTRKAGDARNYPRCQWAANAAIACGQKGIMWFVAPMDKKTLQWTPEKDDIAKVNRSVLPMAKEICRLGNPIEVYSTAAKAAGADAQAIARLKAFGPDSWIQPAAGQFLMGLFADGPGNVIYVVNLDAFNPQEAKLKFTRPVKASIFDRATAQYKPLETHGDTVGLKLAGAAGEMLRVEK